MNQKPGKNNYTENIPRVQRRLHEVIVSGKCLILRS